LTRVFTIAALTCFLVAGAAATAIVARDSMPTAGAQMAAAPDQAPVSNKASKKDKLAAQLTWLANKHELDLPEDRRHERVAPRNPTSVLQLTDGRQYQCRIIDLSLSGAAIEIDVKPAIGVQVMLGTMRGQIVRHFEDGVAIEFAVIQRPETLDSEFNTPRA